MRAAVYYSNGDIRLERRPRPQIGDGEILMRIEASGVCGSDIMEWYRLPKAPLVLGHEVAGVVEEVGAGVERFSVGDRIVATHHVPCNTCRYCRTDRHSCCGTLHSTSFEPGGFCELVRLPAINVERGTFVLPGSVSFEEGTFVEPLACVVRAQRMARVGPGDSVAVLGSGISGILHIQYAKAERTGRILATDVSDYRLEAARRFGADEVVRADAADLVERVRAANNGRLAERVIICTGARSAMEQAFEIVDDGGSVLFFATLPPGEEFALRINDLWKRGVTIVNSYAGPPNDMRTASGLIASRRVDVASMVTHRLGLAETGRGFQLMVEAGKSLKVVIEPQR